MNGVSERVITYAEALNEALRQEMERNPNIIVMGEDVGRYGGIFGVTKGLLEKFGPERVIDTPISEAGFLGAGLGAALKGLHPVVEIMFVDFIGVCFDQLMNQVAFIRYMTGGQAKVPIVIRTQAGGGFRAAAQHSKCIEAIFAHIPGLKLVLPSTPYDAKGLLITALRDENPVVFIEHKRLYNIKGPVPKEPYTIPFGKADIKREGTDVTIVTWSYMVHETLAAAEELAKQGISVEVVDPRTLVPLDEEAILKSVRKTGRLVVVHEDYITCGFGAEIVAIVVEKAWNVIKAPIKRVATPMVPIPFSPVLEDEILPNKKKIVNTVLSVIKESKR